MFYRVFGKNNDSALPHFLAFPERHDAPSLRVFSIPCEKVFGRIFRPHHLHGTSPRRDYGGTEKQADGLAKAPENSRVSGKTDGKKNGRLSQEQAPAGKEAF